MGLAVIEVTGASDDLIELDGDIRDEFSYAGGRDRLVFSDGTILTVEYDREGVWRIRPIEYGGASVMVRPAPDDNEDDYTDNVTLTGDIEWVLHGDQKVKAH